MDRKKKSPRKSVAPKIKDLDAQERKLALIKQKQCDTIALHIVNTLIEGSVQEDVFLQSLKYLNQCHFQDIVEERAISKLCGYPICGNEIKDMPNKKFHISSKTNKVYDITERKNYCSNFCYKAGIFIKDQMLTSPLWYRDREEIPKFHLLPKTETGIPGIEIDQGLIKLDVEDSIDQNFTSISKFAQDMTNKIPENIYIELDNKTDETGIKNKINKEKKACKIGEKDKLEVKEIDSYIFGPNLADILKENSEYFKNQTENSTSNIFELKPSSSNLETCKIKLTNTEFKNQTENNSTSNNFESKPFSSNLETCKIKLTDTEFKNQTDNKSSLTSNSFELKQSSSSLETCKIKFDKTELKNQTEHNIDNKSSLTSNNFEPKSSSSNLKTCKIKLTNTEFKNQTENEIENKSNNFEPKPSSSNLETCKIKFDRTIINTESKGILKKAKNSNKKRVSFSEQIKTKEIENKSEIDKVFKKPEQKNEVNGSKKYKNSNLIGTVQERSSIYKNHLSNDELTQKNNNNPLKSNEELNICDKFQEKQDTSKENRLNRLKNSSSFKKARLSKLALQKNPKIDLKTKLSNCILQWFTFNTILFLYGEENVKDIMSEKSFKQFLNKKKNLELDDKKQQQYEEICKRLNLMDLADQKFDESVTGKKRRPLPKYEDLQQQTEKLDLKVQAFYSGCYEVLEEETETDTESVKDEDEEVKPYIVQGPPAVLPLLDNKDIMATRRKIFQASISRTISNIGEIIQESPNKLLSEINQLINTFQFTASNIVFKNNEWHLITIFLIEILSIRDPDLKKSLSCNEVEDYLTALINELGLESNFVKELLNNVSIQNLLDECLRKDCIL